VGVGDGGAIVGFGVAGMTVGGGVGEDVGEAVGDVDGDAVDDGRLAAGEPESAGLGLAAGAVQAPTRATIRSAATS
jgi:hypothetical protein